jgi:hypothetical protein
VWGEYSHGDHGPPASRIEEGNEKRSLRRPKLSVIKGSSAPEEEEEERRRRKKKKKKEEEKRRRDHEIPGSIPGSTIRIFP